MGKHRRADMNNNMDSTLQIHAATKDIESGGSQLSIQFDQVSYIVNKDQDNEKKVLDKVSLSLASGSLTALMGPSGAGKTTLLNILLNNAAHHLEGMVSANGHRVTEQFAKLCNFVPQDDVMMKSFSPRQALMYQARLRMGQASEDQMRTKVELVLKQLGLTDCADTPTGSVEKRGLSGGQRKRLSVAMELLDDPAVLVLDEPTSGLDSKAAEDLVAFLQSLARGDAEHTSKIVLCTIHQPSWALLERFDELLLVAKGKMLYQGSVQGLPKYYENQSSTKIPQNSNPADHVMRAIQEDGAQTVWADFWADASQCDTKSHPIQQPQQQPAPCAERQYAISGWQQFKILLARNVEDYFKDHEQFVQQISAKIFIGLLLGLCWLNTSRPAYCGENGKAIFTVTGALFMICNNGLMDDMLMTVTGFPQHKTILQREYKNGVYGMLPWFSAFWLTRLIGQITFGFFMILPCYFMIGLRVGDSGEGLFVAVLTLFACSVTGTTLGLGLGAVSSNLDGAFGFVMPIMMPMMLFAGYIIPYGQIPVIWRWLYWLSPFQYSFTTLVINQMIDLEFEDEGCLNGQHIDPTSTTPPYCNGYQYLDTLELDIDPKQYMWRSLLMLGILAMITVFGVYHLTLYKTKSKTG